MFLDNKYSRWYFSIVSKDDQSDIIEIHHIIPRCLGGSNDKSNLVKLSLKKHLLVHHLLTKMTEGFIRRKMLYAYKAMSTYHKNGTRVKLTPSQFEFIKSELRRTPMSEQQRQNHRNGQLGKKLSEEHKKKISEGGIGLKRTQQTKDNIGKSLKGRIFSEAHREKISKNRTGTIIPDEIKAKISKTITGRILPKDQIEKTRKALQKFIYKLISPEGEEIITKDLKQFCLQHQLPYNYFSALSRVGKIHEKTGWYVERTIDETPTRVLSPKEQKRKDSQKARYLKKKEPRGLKPIRS